MKQILLALFLVFRTFAIFAQIPTDLRSEGLEPSVKSNEILVQLKGNDPYSLLQSQSFAPVFINWRPVAPEWRMYALLFDPAQHSLETAMAAAQKLPEVQFAQFNHRILERNVEPNDPSWSLQDDMTLIKADKAWDSSTGGISPNGDTIVVAVLEKGILFTHPDLAPNRWFNRGEIPGNKVDDDGNGYIDDFAGWNPRNLNDDTGTNGTHGTGVTGIIGAAGNNNQGVTGVNWNIKIMAICNIEFEDEIIAGYHYVNTMRRLYNQSGGKKGAFVVATNASFGIDNAQPEAHPLWCAVYDSTGINGILNIGATTNANSNVEITGDMPTRCTSQYLVAVNNVGKTGAKSLTTGYGKVSIDLGAPGTDTYTTANLGTNQPGYARLGGTSAATPHVTGAVGLLYSFNCKTLSSDALTDPAACARRVRDIILYNVEPEESLKSVTTTGGYLNLEKALAAVVKLCNGSVGQMKLLDLFTRENGKNITLFYQVPNFDPYYFKVYNTSGMLVHEETLHPLEFQANFVEFDASQLPNGTYYLTIGKGQKWVSRKFLKI